MGRCPDLDPPKSPLRRGTLRRILFPIVGAVPRVPALFMGNRNSTGPHKKLVLPLQHHRSNTRSIGNKGDRT